MKANPRSCSNLLATHTSHIADAFGPCGRLLFTDANGNARTRHRVSDCANGGDATPVTQINPDQPRPAECAGAAAIIAPLRTGRNRPVAELNNLKIDRSGPVASRGARRRWLWWLV